MRLANNLEFSLFQALNMIAQKLATDPSTTTEGQVWYNTTTKQLKIRTATANVVLADDSLVVHNTLLGAASGVATLDSGGKIPVAQLPATVTGALDYQGVWNASTNSPTLASGGTGNTKGDYYKVSVAGATALDGITDWKVGDWVVFNGTTWDKLDQTENISSVAGRTGAVVLAVADVAGAAATANNLSDLSNAGTARTNLGLGTAATRSVPASGNAASTEVVLGSDTRLTSSPLRFSSNVGDGTATSFIITHNLNTQDVVVMVRTAASPFGVELPDIELTSVNTITLRFGFIPTANQYRVSIVG